MSNLSTPRIVKLRLIIDVDYDLSEGATEQDAHDMLKSLPGFAASNGLLSGFDAPLLVDTWDYRIEDRA